jgi:thioredoxin-like negative regulator of GroEL
MLKKLNPSIIISSLSIIAFTIIKILVLIEFCQSTRETRAAEFILLLIFGTFYVRSIRNLISKKTEKLASDMNSIVKIVKINVDENNKYSSEYGVRSIPNLILFKNGSKVDEMVGFKTVEQLKEFIEKHNK